MTNKSQLFMFQVLLFVLNIKLLSFTRYELSMLGLPTVHTIHISEAKWGFQDSSQFLHANSQTVPEVLL